MTKARTPSKVAWLSASVIGLTAWMALVPASVQAKRLSLALSFGQDVRIFGDDTLSLRAQCIQNQGGNDIVRIYAATASDATMRGLNVFWGNGSYLTPATPAAESRMAQLTTPTGQESSGMGGVDAGAYVFNLATRIGYAFAQETSFVSLNLGGSDCYLSADIETIKRFKQAK